MMRRLGLTALLRAHRSDGKLSTRLSEATPLPKRLMFPRLFFIVCLATIALPGCKTPYKESDKKREDQKHDASNDPSFQGFIGRLRIAVQKRDHETLRALMVPDFGYRWDNPPPGDNVFTYWDLNNLWPDLNALLRQSMVPLDDFMVSPPEFAADPKNFAGYRLGVKQMNGSWRFVYFVPPPPPEQMPAPGSPQ